MRPRGVPAEDRRPGCSGVLQRGRLRLKILPAAVLLPAILSIGLSGAVRAASPPTTAFGVMLGEAGMGLDRRIAVVRSRDSSGQNSPPPARLLGL